MIEIFFFPFFFSPIPLKYYYYLKSCQPSNEINLRLIRYFLIETYFLIFLSVNPTREITEKRGIAENYIEKAPFSSPRGWRRRVVAVIFA